MSAIIEQQLLTAYLTGAISDVIILQAVRNASVASVRVLCECFTSIPMWFIDDSGSAPAPVVVDALRFRVNSYVDGYVYFGVCKECGRKYYIPVKGD